MARPLIAIPSRFSDSASALRYRAEVSSRNLVEAVWAAGGEPLMMHPAPLESEPLAEAIADRLRWADGVLLPGGGDLSGRWSGQDSHETLYDVDELQDEFDLAIARHCLATGLPLFAVCRGLQVVNVALGGTLNQDMVSSGEYAADHRHYTHQVKVDANTELAHIVGELITASCYHHQVLGELADGLEPTAYAADGVLEAAQLINPKGWFVGIQWHPEDTWATDPAQLALFAALVAAAQTSAEERLARAGSTHPAQPHQGPRTPWPPRDPCLGD